MKLVSLPIWFALLSLTFSTITMSSLKPGGLHTHQKAHNRSAFMHPSPALSAAQKMDFVIGQAIFEKIWVFAPASTRSSDGLGPLYNARSCARCHRRNGRGMIESGSSSSPALFLRLSIEPDTPDAQVSARRFGPIPEPSYGKQLQTFAYPGGPAEAKLSTRYDIRTTTLDDHTTVTLHAPVYNIEALAYGALHSETRYSPRIAPPMIGLGLLEAINANDIIAWADPHDEDGDGISGKANWVWDVVAQQSQLGRFGWKAGSPSLDQQNNAALNGDMGISNWIFPQHAGDCTTAQTECLTQVHGTLKPDANQYSDDKRYDAFEATKVITDALLHFTRYIAVPQRNKYQAEASHHGEKVFHDAGCPQCHRPSFVTSDDAESPLLRSQTIWPYSDLLLHDMGEGLADHRQEFLASGREWRTPPLWGLGHTQTVGGGEFYLHDGRARSILEAILWHGGEAQASTDYVKALAKPEREALIDFLKSL